ncbi:MAG: hypothetical protein E5W69_03655, partial [Mesorhizobium sp.]
MSTTSFFCSTGRHQRPDIEAWGRDDGQMGQNKGDLNGENPYQLSALGHLGAIEAIEMGNACKL